MEFKIFSRKEAQTFTYSEECCKNCIIISITDVSSEKNIFNPKNPHIKGVLHIQFDDVCLGQPNCITINDAKKILRFVRKNIRKTEMIVVHCERGVSRSAGVCFALKKIVTGYYSDMANPKYNPNMSCFYTVLCTYYSFFSDCR